MRDRRRTAEHRRRAHRVRTRARRLRARRADGVPSPTARRARDVARRRRATTTPQATYKEAEAAFLEHRKPFEEAVAAARRARTRTSGRSTPRPSKTCASRWTRRRTSSQRSYEEMLATVQGASAPASASRWSPPAACTSSAPSGTRAGASTTSCAAAPAVRAIPARRASTSRSRTTCCASSAPSASRASMERLGMEEGEPIEHRLITRAIANAQSKVEAPQLRHPQASARVRRRDEQAARGRSTRAAATSSAARGSREDVLEIAEGLADASIEQFDPSPRSPPAEWDWKALDEAILRQFNIRLALHGRGARGHDGRRALAELTFDAFTGALRGEGAALHARRSCASSRRSSCCRPSTRSGRTTSSAWII